MMFTSRGFVIAAWPSFVKALCLLVLTGKVLVGQVAVTPIVYSSGTETVQTRGEASEYVVLRVVRAWYPFETDRGGWPAAVPMKVDSGFRLFEAAIWPDRNAVHLYAFPKAFDPNTATWTEREEYAISEVEELPVDSADLSEALRLAFEEFFEIILQRHPLAAFGLSYAGHGTATGALFENSISIKDAHRLMQSWVSSYGGKIEFIDFGGNCVEGQLSTLVNFSPFANYIIASDLNVGGYEMDAWTIEKWNEVSSTVQLGLRLRPGKSVLDAWKEITDLRRRRWEYSRESMVSRRIPQSTAVFDSAAFSQFVADMYTTSGTRFSDQFGGRPDLSPPVQESRYRRSKIPYP